MTKQDIINLLIVTNDILTGAIVILTAAILLYNFTRNVRDRVIRSSSILLGCVMFAYLADSFTDLGASLTALEWWYRFQWIGVAFVPAALFHLSDALLATTGLVSRRKRRLVIRILYLVGLVFFLAALFTDGIVAGLVEEPVSHMNPGDFFPIYFLYFVLAAAGAMHNVIRAWRRCLTTYTRRRMTYLVAVFLTPALGIFPYSLLISVIFSGIGSFPEGWLWLIFNIANFATLTMLAFMAYPLAFYGAYKPDRIVRAEFLEFMLRGPLAGVVVIAVIQTFPRFTKVLGLPGDELMPFAAVASVMFIHWMISIFQPYLEKWLIYTSGQAQARRLREISERMLTKEDSAQLLEAILAAICDQLQVPTAFIASLHPNGKARLEQVVGDAPRQPLEVADDATLLLTNDHIAEYGDFFRWESFLIKTLHAPMDFLEDEESEEQGQLLGVLGIWTEAATFELHEDKKDIFNALLKRATYILMDMQMQARMISTLEDLLREVESKPNRRETSAVSPYGQLAVNGKAKWLQLDSLVYREDFAEFVKEALRDYWGGPKLAESELLNLHVVNNVAVEEEGNRVRALRRILSNAIESLRPDGQQNLTTSDWMLYNILEMRFLQGRKVQEVAHRLAMSNSDFYRKQRVAIEEVARIIADTELKTVKANTEPEKLDSIPPNLQG